MSSAEPRGAGRTGRPGMGRGLTAALAGVLLAGVAAVLYVIVSALATPGSAAGLTGLNHGAMAKLEVLANPVPAAAGAVR